MKRANDRIASYNLDCMILGGARPPGIAKSLPAIVPMDKALHSSVIKFSEPVLGYSFVVTPLGYNRVLDDRQRPLFFPSLRGAA